MLTSTDSEQTFSSSNEQEILDIQELVASALVSLHTAIEVKNDQVPVCRSIDISLSDMMTLRLSKTGSICSATILEPQDSFLHPVLADVITYVLPFDKRTRVMQSTQRGPKTDSSSKSISDARAFIHAVVEPLYAELLANTKEGGIVIHSIYNPKSLPLATIKFLEKAGYTGIKDGKLEKVYVSQARQYRSFSAHINRTS